MNRRSFLTTLGAAAVLPFIPKTVAAVLKAAGAEVGEPPTVASGIASYEMWMDDRVMQHVFVAGPSQLRRAFLADLPKGFFRKIYIVTPTAPAFSDPRLTQWPPAAGE